MPKNASLRSRLGSTRPFLYTLLVVADDRAVYQHLMTGRVVPGVLLRPEAVSPRVSDVLLCRGVPVVQIRETLNSVFDEWSPDDVKPSPVASHDSRTCSESPITRQAVVHRHQDELHGWTA